MPTVCNIKERRTNKGDHDETPVPEDTLEDIELVVQPPAVEGIKDLSKDEGIEHDRRHNPVALLCVIQTEDCVAKEVEDE